jgi:TctA family transporter
VIETAAALEATALAQFLKSSRWVYPLVNAGHILGIALLVGSVVPMDVAVLRGRGSAAVSLLRRWSVGGFVLAVACGVFLFITQATDYVQSGWFRAKMALLVVATINAAAHVRLDRLVPRRRRQAALASLILWPAILILGRMIAYG